MRQNSLLISEQKTWLHFSDTQFVLIYRKFNHAIEKTMLLGLFSYCEQNPVALTAAGVSGCQATSPAADGQSTS